MSFAYRVFEIPRTFDEFVDQVGKKGNTSVDIIRYAKDRGGRCGKLGSFHCSVHLESEGTHFKLAEYSHDKLGIYGSTLIEEYYVIQASLRGAVDVAEKLEGLGLEARIHGQSVSDSRELIALCGERIEELKQVYGNPCEAEAF